VQKPPVVKKFPDSTTVQNLKNIFSKMFAIPYGNQEIHCRQ